MSSNNNTKCIRQSSNTSCTRQSSDTSRIYPNLEYARLINDDPSGQTGIGDQQPIIFTRLITEKGDVVNPARNAADIILEECAVYFVIYESTLNGSEAATLGLHLDLDGKTVPASESTATVTAATQKVTLVSHAIVGAQKDRPNILRLLVDITAGTATAIGANITIIKLAHVRKGEDCC